MKFVFAYVRVSTQKQGVHGASLQEQREAISAFATRENLSIIQWFEERETAAKRGRAQFQHLLDALGKGKASGVIFHKIDRGARNLRDWADLGELVDRGIEVHLAHETIDLTSRGGRLSADIQAVVAADYIRNLRQEVKKGIYGRYRKGLFPRQAPVGYRDCGKGKVKEIHATYGPLVREAFELYATGEYSFEKLRVEMETRGLRGLNNSRVTKNTFTAMLNNPFYYGLIYVKRTNETFEGAHEPLISKALFDRVQVVLRSARLSGSKAKHKLLFRRLIRCQLCGQRLIGERIKAKYIYYRCHNRACGVVCLSERAIDAELSVRFRSLRIDAGLARDVRDVVDNIGLVESDGSAKRVAALELELDRFDARIDKLTDLLIDGSVDKEEHNQKKRKILDDKRRVRDQIEASRNKPTLADTVKENLELANAAYSLYATANDAEKRVFLERITSNFMGAGNKPIYTLVSPFQELSEWHLSRSSAPQRDNKPALASKILAILGGVSEEEISASVARINAKRQRHHAENP